MSAAGMPLIQTLGGRSVLVTGGLQPCQFVGCDGECALAADRGAGWTWRREVPPGCGSGGWPCCVGVERFPAAKVLWAGETLGTCAAVQPAGLPYRDWGSSPEKPLPGRRSTWGMGAMLRVLYAGESGAVLLSEWGNFRALCRVGKNQAALKELLDDPALTPGDCLAAGRWRLGGRLTRRGGSRS